jgi:transposase
LVSWTRVSRRTTQHLPGERYRRLVKRIGKFKAHVAVVRSVLMIMWHLRARPA